MSKHRLVAALSALIAVGLILLAVISAGGGAGDLPPGLVIATATPDTSRVITPEAAAARIATQSARARSVLEAVAAGDAARLRVSFATVDKACTPPGRRGDSELCVNQAQNVTPMMNIGHRVPFFVGAERIRGYVADLTANGRLVLKFAAISQHDTNKIFLGFETEGAGIPGSPPLAASDSSMTGISFVLDASAQQPVVAARVLTDTWRAVQQGEEFGQLEPVEIIAYVP